MTSMTLSMNKTFVKTGKAKKSSEKDPTPTYGGTWVGTFVKTGKAKSPEINKVVEKIDSGDDSTENEIEEHTTEKFEPKEIIETHELDEFNEESEIEESESESVEKSEVSETNEIADINENLYEPCKTFESSNKIDEQNEIIDEIIEANTKLLPEVLTKKTPRNLMAGISLLIFTFFSTLKHPLKLVIIESVSILECSFEDLAEKIGKIRYHYFKNSDFQKMLTVKSA